MKAHLDKIIDGVRYVWDGDQARGYAAAGPATADAWRDPNPWHPISNPVDLKHLGKLAEEANELGAAIARCIIQGVDECEPVTGKMNRLWLEEEIADVMANIDLVVQRFRLNRSTLADRRARKMAHLIKWHNQA